MEALGSISSQEKKNLKAFARQDGVCLKSQSTERLRLQDHGFKPNLANLAKKGGRKGGGRRGEGKRRGRKPIVSIALHFTLGHHICSTKMS